MTADHEALLREAITLLCSVTHGEIGRDLVEGFPFPCQPIHDFYERLPDDVRASLPPEVRE